MKIATAFVEVRPDTKRFAQDLQRETTEHAKKTAVGLGNVLGGAAFLAGAKRATDAASSLEQAVGGTAAVFGQASKEVDRFAKEAAESAGLSERAARELTSQLGGLLKGFGFTADEAAGLSIQLATLGADLAATFGGSPEEAVQALGAALRGETDPLERFGVALNQTLVNQKAVELGLAETTSQVDQQAKAQATLALITERSADAQGQFAREADTAAGQAAIAAAKAENSAADLGDNLLPIYTKLAETVGAVADVFGALPEPVQTAAIALAGVAVAARPATAGIELAKDGAGLARRAFDSAATGAYTLAGNLGRLTVGAGALGAAFVAGSYLLGQYQKDKAEAAQIEEEYTRILSEQTKEVGRNAAAFASQQLFEGDLGGKLRQAGADMGALTAGITEQADEIEHLGDKWDISYAVIAGGSEAVRRALERAGIEGGVFADELIRIADSGALTTEEIQELVKRLDAQASGYKVGAREAENKAAADEAAGITAEDAAPKIDTNTEAISRQEEALERAKTALDRFKEGMEDAFAPIDLEAAVDRRAQDLADLAQAIEDRAEAVENARRRIADLQAIPVEDRPDDYARQVADAQRVLDEAIADTSLTLDGNTDAALRNRDELRGLVEDVGAIIEKHRDEGATLEDLQIIRAMEVQNLEAQLEQMGYNRDEIARYIGAIEDIPLSRETVLTVEAAKAFETIASLQSRLDTLFATGQGSSVDVLQAESQLMRQNRPTRGFALGGAVPDGEFWVGEYGTAELLRKQGSRVDVVAGATPTPVGADLGGLEWTNEAQLAVLQSIDAAIRSLAGSSSPTRAPKGAML